MALSEEHSFLLKSVVNWFNQNEQVSHYTEEVYSGPNQAESFLLSSLPKEGTVLDVGCGAGRISLELARLGYTVTGIDVSGKLINVAREVAIENNLDIRFCHTESQGLAFDDSQFDIVVAFKVLCYLPTKDLRMFLLSDLYRVLKPGGSCVLTQNIVPDEFIDEAKDEHFINSPASRFSILEPGDNFPLGIGYVHWFTSYELLEEIRNTKFEVTRFESDENYGGSGYLRLVELKKPCYIDGTKDF
ncbi:class I SAM-dependent methyltransferase [Paenibacillus sp. sptzw28]|uniref:class I SAM-dependent methyltransferase n=1 Tax=Paenibacillus sp. sptzw28 TaxID=715179 RepID=UPI001C6EE3BD|nr:class I SAM-dependent methyltransferase [Paenibacillus sp. sptzw28]QYR23461.1 class I SAM-dependent methyltransferase [Paenibacillus sp. sptzw28]